MALLVSAGGHANATAAPLSHPIDRRTTLTVSLIAVVGVILGGLVAAGGLSRQSRLGFHGVLARLSCWPHPARGIQPGWFGTHRPRSGRRLVC